MGKDASSVAVAVRSAGDFEVLPEDTELFHSHLRSFVPPEAFDAHAHFYERSHIGPTFESSYLKSAPDPGGWAAYRRQVSKWMGDRTAKGGLFFAMPRRDVDMAGANRFLAAETEPGGSAESPDAHPSRGRSGPGAGTDRLPGVRGL